MDIHSSSRSSLVTTSVGIELSIKRIGADSLLSIQRYARDMRFLAGTEMGHCHQKSKLTLVTIWTVNRGGAYFLKSIHDVHPRSVYGRSLDEAKGALAALPRVNVNCIVRTGVAGESGERRATSVW